MKVSHVLLILWILVLSLPAKTGSQDEFQSYISTKDDLKTFLEKMPLEDRVGQVFMFGFPNTKPSKDLSKFLKKTRPGFLVLFKKNIVSPLQTSKLIYALQKNSFSKTNMQITFAVDQEGGDVVRIPTDPPLPTALAMGRSGDSATVNLIGKEVGSLLKVLGISMNLAPVLDLAPPENNSFIQSRSFGNDPEMVSKFADSFSSGLNASNVASTAKHFPGLGSSKQDSHKTSVVAGFEKKDISTFLKPYKELIKKNSIQAVMLTHLIYPALDESGLPATFSSKITGLLRDTPFEGLIMTDDVEMAGAKIFNTPEKRSVEAFRAGSDVIMVAWNRSSQVRAYEGLLDAVKKGDIGEERLNKSVYRILQFKEKFGLLEKPVQRDRNEILNHIKGLSIKQPIDTIFSGILEEESKKISAQKELLDFSRVAVVSNDYSHFKDLRGELGVSSRFFTSTTKSLEDLSKFDPSLILFFITGGKSAKTLARLSNRLNPRVLAINMIYPGSLNPKLYLESLEIGMKHPDMAPRLAEILSRFNELRSPGSEARKEKPKNP